MVSIYCRLISTDDNNYVLITLNFHSFDRDLSFNRLEGNIPDFGGLTKLDTMYAI